MSVRRAIPVVVTDDPAGTRAFYEGFLGLRAAMDEAGFLMLVSTTEPTTQVIVAWAVDGAMDPSVRRVDVRRGREAVAQNGTNGDLTPHAGVKTPTRPIDGGRPKSREAN